MNIFGIGPALLLAGASGFGLAKALDAYGGITYSFEGFALAAATVVASPLLLAGLYFWLASIIGLKATLADGKLLTEGIYARTRNPMYAAFIIFLVPALALLLNNLVYLLAAPLMYAVFDLLIGREEKFLLEKFGPQYQDYAERTPRLFPRLLD